MEARFVDTTLRDGHQSLWALGMTTGMMEAVAADIDQAGFAAVDVPAFPLGFKKLVRDHKEDPWETMRLLTRKLRNTVKTSMAGGFIHPFDPPPPRAIVRLFYERLAAIGALNRAQITANTTSQLERTFPWLVPMLKELGFQVVVALSYTISPRHTDEYYGQKTRDILPFRPDAIYLKDQSGLLTPDRIRTLIPVIVANAGGVPVELHSHCTTGLAPLCYLEALQLGVQTLHTAIPPLANGSSQPSVFNVANNARHLGFSAPINLEALRRAAERLTQIARQEGLPIGAPPEYDQWQYVHQMPGGVISNLIFQLAEIRLQDRLHEVMAEVVQVRQDLGYPIMITPLSQFVVTQAAINVAVGERYKVVTDEIIHFALGTYGEDSGYTWMDPNVKDKVLGLPRARELSAWQPPQTSLAEIRAKIGGPGVSDEELLLRFIMKGENEIRAMRAAGPPRQYPADMPLLALLEGARQHTSWRYVQIEKGNDSLILAGDAQPGGQAT